MHRLVFRNDRLLPLGEVNLSPGQAGLLNGWGLFTTMRIYDGQPFAFERHWQRLNRDAARIELPLRYQFPDVSRALRQVIESNAVQNGCARIYFIYNKVGFWSSDEPFPVVDFLIYTNDLPTRIGPTVLGVIEHGRHAAHPLAGVKVTSWLHNVWSLEQAHQRGFEEVILLNERNEVAECTAANIFLIRAGQLETPPLSSGCLAGVTREILLELAPELGLPVIQRPLTLAEVYQAEEVFITSSLREVQPVARIEDHTVSQAPGPVTTRLAEAFSAFVGRSLARP
jgi:branched-chain amino acid aminotransferase